MAAVMNDARPVLFFDSGVGGLSVLAAARALLPTMPAVYVADSAGFPYGTKSEAEIAARVPALLGRVVERYRPRLVVIACNTASTIALAHVRAALDVGVVGTVPAIKPAAERSRTRVIGVLGTEATVRQGYVDDLARRFAGDCRVVRHGSAALVDLAEAKLRGGQVSPDAVAAAIGPLGEEPALDTVVLACTHFPLLADEIAAAFGGAVALVDGSAGIARRIAFLTQGQTWPARASEGIAVFTGDAVQTEALAPALARYGLDRMATL